MERRYYLGIDLDDRNAIISFFTTENPEPETVSPIAGSGMFQIPLALAKKNGIGQWFIGADAAGSSASQGNGPIDRLFSRAMERETVVVEGESYEAEELLGLFLKKLLLLPGRLGNPRTPDRLVIALEELSLRTEELFAGLAPRLGLMPEQLMLIDRKESFYYFAYSQEEKLCMHDICLFDCQGETLICRRAERNQRTTPQLITLTEMKRTLKADGRDEAFLAILQETLQGHIVSSAYLVGDGFDGNWMKRSVSFLCKGRHAFIGKNLYSKGACYAAAVRERPESWKFVYLGENELKVNVSLKVTNRGREEFYSLLSAGKNWYETSGECEVILAGEPEIDFWLQLPGSREAKVEKLSLSDFPLREERASRLRIMAKPVSDAAVRIRIRDMGFGELFQSSEKTWEYLMSLSGGQEAAAARESSTG